MRLIDADALHDALESGPELYVSDVFIVAGTIDAAPTVSCEKCKHFDDTDDPCGWCFFLELAVPMEDFGCAYFERREP